MAPEPHHVQVEIFGQTYKLRAEDDPAYVESLAAIVDGKMREIAKQTNAVDSLKVAILAALNIADENLRGASAGAPGSALRSDDAEADRRVEDMLSLLDKACSA